MTCPIIAKYKTYAHCANCRSNPKWRGRVKAPEVCPEGYTESKLPVLLGDAVHKLALPVAKLLGLPCVDKETGMLKPASPCAERRKRMNRHKLL